MDEQALAQRAAQILYDKKAVDVEVLHVGHLTVVTDYMVIAGGRTALQVGVDFRQRGAPVDLRLAFAEQVEVGAVQEQEFRHGTPR